MPAGQSKICAHLIGRAIRKLNTCANMGRSRQPPLASRSPRLKRAKQRDFAKGQDSRKESRKRTCEKSRPQWADELGVSEGVNGIRRARLPMVPMAGKITRGRHAALLVRAFRQDGNSSTDFPSGPAFGNCSGDQVGDGASLHRDEVASHGGLARERSIVVPARQQRRRDWQHAGYSGYSARRVEQGHSTPSNPEKRL